MSVIDPVSVNPYRLGWVNVSSAVVEEGASTLLEADEVLASCSVLVSSRAFVGKVRPRVG